MPTQASALIAKLNTVGANKTPDQIVAILNTNGWIKASDVTQAMLDQHSNVTQFSICHHNNYSESWNHDGNNFTLHMWRLEEYQTGFLGRLPYWFKPTDQWQGESDVPYQVTE